MTIGSGTHSQRRTEQIVGAISVGFFLVLVGALFVIVPNLFTEIVNFIRDFDLVRIPNTEVFLPAPVHAAAHVDVYSAAEQFSIVWGFFQVAVLALRFVFHSRLRTKGETVSNIVFSFGTAFLIQTLLIDTTRWFPFWAAIIILVGVSLIARAIFLGIARMASRSTAQTTGTVDTTAASLES